MQYDPDLHHRRSIRLRDYDYSQSGAYFVTMCVQKKEHLFGTVRDGEVQLNHAGVMIERWWSVLPNKFPSITTDTFVVMPNHAHGIIGLNAEYNEGEHTGSPLHHEHNDVWADQCVRLTLGTVIQWFKTMTTNEYIRSVHAHGWLSFDRRLWQRNYYEHVIRNNDDLNAIREYTVNNPARWQHT